MIQDYFFRLDLPSPREGPLSVADRISELEKQQSTKYRYLDPDKKHRVSDPTLKAIQKKALLSFYERHHNNQTPNKQMAWRSEPQLAQPLTVSAKPQSPPPQPPPRPSPQHHTVSRRASSASDYAKGTWRQTTKKDDIKEILPRHQHSNSCGSLSNDLLGPVIMGPSISIDDWVPERPPKNPHLRQVFPDLFQRIPSPDLPPPSPPIVLENEVINNDDPLPPPPPEIETECWSNQPISRTDEKKLRNSISLDESIRFSPPKTAEPQVRHSLGSRNIDVRSSQRVYSSSRSPFVRSTSYEKDSVAFATHRQIPTERTSMRHQKLNGRAQGQFRAEPLRPHHVFMSAQEQTNSQKPAPQVPKQPEFRPRTQSVTDNGHYNGGCIAPPLKPRQSKAYQSMRHMSSRQYAVTMNDDMGTGRFLVPNTPNGMNQKEREQSNDGRKSTTSLSP